MKNICPEFVATRLSTLSTLTKLSSLFAIALALSSCESGSSSSSGGSAVDAKECIKRTLATVYINECDYDVNVIILKKGEKHFKVKADDASTRSASDEDFGACKAPSIPVLSSDSKSYVCESQTASIARQGPLFV